jgi:serine/threonine-protein kinase ULK4
MTLPNLLCLCFVLLPGMASSSSKVQTSAVNMLNLALSAQQVPAALRGALGDERQLVGAVINLLDHSLPLLRAKAIIAVVLLCR